MSRSGRFAVAVWLAWLLACGVLVARAQFSADLSAFLPDAPTAAQRLLVDQLKSGIAARLILVGIEGGTPAQRIRASQALAQRLRSDPQFRHLANGEIAAGARDRELLFAHRYALSPAVDAARFSVAGLAAAAAESVDLLASSAGLLGKQLLPRDPTGEFLQVLDTLDGGSRPRREDGVWVSGDGRRALLLAHTRAEGADIDAQARAMQALDAAFRAVAAPGLRLVLSGPGPFAVEARATIRDEVTRLSAIGALVIIALLLAVYRSPSALLLGLLPVLTGALTGVAAVSLGFGTVHGVTLGFGTALIGEAVDYSIYLLVQTGRGHAGSLDQAAWIARYWPTIRIGVLTSVFGFAALLFSGFPGLAQLGLYAIGGLVSAAVVTRHVLPHLLPATLRLRDIAPLGTRVQGWLPRIGGWRGPLYGLFAVALGVLVSQRDGLWNRELAALSPVPAAALALDAALRAELGAAEAGILVVATAASAEAALVASERIAQALQPLVGRGVIGGFEAPSRYLPSRATQAQRRASLPPEAALRTRFQAALAGLPLRPGHFEPFFADVAAARTQAPLTRADLDGTALAQAVDALLLKTADGRWSALVPLRAPAGSQRIDAAAVRAALAATRLANVHYLDIKRESDRLYDAYLREALLLALAGVFAIIGLLFAVVRAPRRVLRISLPLAMAVAVVAAGLVLAGRQLILLHLVGMLLIVAVGSNYALFFDRGAVAGDIDPRTLASLLLAVATTVAGFGILGFSSVPVLQAIGVTVGPGAILALLFAAILSRRA